MQSQTVRTLEGVGSSLHSEAPFMLATLTRLFPETPGPAAVSTMGQNTIEGIGRLLAPVLASPFLAAFLAVGWAKSTVARKEDAGV